MSEDGAGRASRKRGQPEPESPSTWGGQLSKRKNMRLAQLDVPNNNAPPIIPLEEMENQIGMRQSHGRGGAQADNAQMVDEWVQFAAVGDDGGIEGGHKREKGCRCGRTKCLKQYCQCFRNNVRCSEDCVCADCHNDGRHEDKRTSAIRHIRMNYPGAFKGTTLELEDQEVHTPRGSVKTVRGCRCKRSKCTKKYCECYGVGLRCTTNCVCTECANGNMASSPRLQEPPRQVMQQQAAAVPKGKLGARGMQQQQQQEQMMYAGMQQQMQEQAAQQHHMQQQQQQQQMRNKANYDQANYAASNMPAPMQAPSRYHSKRPGMFVQVPNPPLQQNTGNNNQQQQMQQNTGEGQPFNIELMTPSVFFNDMNSTKGFESILDSPKITRQTSQLSQMSNGWDLEPFGQGDRQTSTGSMLGEYQMSASNSDLYSPRLTRRTSGLYQQQMQQQQQQQQQAPLLREQSGMQFQREVSGGSLAMGMFGSGDGSFTPLRRSQRGMCNMLHRNTPPVSPMVPDNFWGDSGIDSVNDPEALLVEPGSARAWVNVALPESTPR